MSRLVYLRHAQKEYNNGDSNLYKHDPGIIESGIERTKMVAKHLIDSWGEPDIIVSSPYKRTRETAIIMNSVLKNPLSIKIESELSEYLGNHKNVPIDVTPETKIWNPPHPETFADMNIRVKKHYNKVIKFTKKNPSSIKVIWFITHGLIMKQISKLIGIKLNTQRLPTLTCLSIVEDDKVLKGEILTFRDERDLSNSTERSYDQEEKDVEITSN